jgi:squalene cyclase
MSSCEHKHFSALKPTVTAILGEQNDDGGWSQTPDMPSDAYATGQTLYVLACAGVKPGAPEMRRGVEFLNHTQQEDGSWPMTSRVKARNLNPIIDAGTGWAVLGLIRASR